MKHTYTGVIHVPIVELKFAFSGKVSWVKKQEGDTVAQWEAIASLDKKLLQAELDRQLADYEKIRAEFELFCLKFGRENGDDTTKYLRTQKQADLNRSVKEVEIAKYKLDQTDLVCPVEGTIVSLGGLTAGLHITPASSTIIVATGTQRLFVFSVSQKDSMLFCSQQEATVNIDHVDGTFTGKTRPITQGQKGIFAVSAVLSKAEILVNGMEGMITIHSGDK